MIRIYCRRPDGKLMRADADAVIESKVDTEAWIVEMRSHYQKEIGSPLKTAIMMVIK